MARDINRRLALTGWEWGGLVAWLLAISLSVLLVHQRRLVFGKGEYGFWTEDSAPLFFWGLICLAALVLVKPCSSDLYRLILRPSGMALSLACTMFMLLCVTAWGRYGLYRFEALHQNLYITNHQGVKLALAIKDEEKTGSLLLSDKALRNYGLQELGSDYLVTPSSAGRLISAELNSGTKFEQIEKAGQAHEVLLGALVYQVSVGENVLSLEQGRAVVAWFAEHPARLTSDVLERLLFVAMRSSDFVLLEHTEVFLDRWARGFDELQPLAVEGLVVRKQVQELLPSGADTVKVSLTISGSAPSDYYYRNMGLVTERVALGLVRSCGVRVARTSPTEAELQIEIRLSQVPHHNYSTPVYEYETYYEYVHHGRSRPIGGYMTRTRREKRVLKGHDEKTSYAPVAALKLQSNREVVEFEELLLFWHHLRYDHEQGRFKDGPEDYGRMWPLGVSKDLFEWEEERP